MTDLRKAAEMALEYLNSVSDWDCTYPIGKAKETLRQALAQPEQVLTARVVITGVDAVNMSQECVDETVKDGHKEKNT